MFIPWLVEFILRVIPETLLFIGTSFVLTKTKIDKKKFILSSLLFLIVEYLIRVLPVNYGIPSLVGLILLIFINIEINKIQSVASVKTSVIIFIIMFISEFISIVFMQVVLKINMNEVFKNAAVRALVGVPSLIIFAIIIFIIHKRFKKLINI